MLEERKVRVPADPVTLEGSLAKKLDGYQQEGYQALVKIAKTHNGAFLCDGVGLGKTFIGMMLIERLMNVSRALRESASRPPRRA